MAGSLHVIALISGGKDSLYSILHCLENGHKVVALANLYPGQHTSARVEEARTEVGDTAEDDDLNSFMYQTVGHSIIPLYEDCLGIPLYRRAITGSAVQTGQYYDSSSLASSPDETEDLIPLMREILEAHPKANALCSGAILSTYQRTRVESVALRLGLMPLAYLWQYPALPSPRGRDESLTGLLDDMTAAGCDARIIKIASGGIKESLLWSNVADPRTKMRLVNGLQPFFQDHEFWLRGAVLGEGGEYETLAINGPRRLWRKRIEIPDATMSILTGQGGVSYLRFADARTAEQVSQVSADELESLRLPNAFDFQFETVLATFESREPWMIENGRQQIKDSKVLGSIQSLSNTLKARRAFTTHHLSISNLTAGDLDPRGTPGTAAAQMKKICHDLKSYFDKLSTPSSKLRQLAPSDIVSTILLLKDMSNFSLVNPVYASLFRTGEPNPPARVTIACPLPSDVEVCMSVVIDLGPREARRGLHVQSRSYWAPANIGPYSQAISVPLDKDHDPTTNIHDAELVEMVHVAGQIPLIPQTMQPWEADFSEQAMLSLQHLWRVGQERGVDAWPWGIVFLAKWYDGPIRAELASCVWQQAHLAGTRPQDAEGMNEDDKEGPDAWDRQFNRAASFETLASHHQVGRHLHVLPNQKVFRSTDGNESTLVPAFIAAEVDYLPRNCPIEWWSMGVAHLPKPPTSKQQVSSTGKNYPWGSINLVTIFPPTDSATTRSVHLVTVLVYRAAVNEDIEETFASIESDLLALLWSDRDSSDAQQASAEAVHGTAFVSAHSSDHWSWLHRRRFFEDSVTIPCHSVYGCSNSGTINAPKPLHAAMTMRIDTSCGF